MPSSAYTEAINLTSKLLQRLSVFVATGMVALLGTMAGQASAAPVTCGTVITTSTVLTNDVGPCSSDGLIIGANNITLDLGGHTVFGVPNHPGNGVGILSQNHSGVVIQRGTVKQFDAGVAIIGGSGNTVQQLIVTQNVGSSTTDFGDGIALDGTNNNTIQTNVVTFNGPFDGIGLFDGASNNTIRSNVITDNNVIRLVGMHGVTAEDDGIRLEPGSHFNVITGNDIERNLLDGVGVFFQSSDNTVIGNNIVGNGFHDPTINRLGDGIHVFLQADRTLVQGNVVNNNAEFGIVVNSMSNSILANSAHGNSLGDLIDTNANCDANQWHANNAGTGSPSCTLAP